MCALSAAARLCVCTGRRHLGCVCSGRRPSVVCALGAAPRLRVHWAPGASWLCVLCAPGASPSAMCTLGAWRLHRPPRRASPPLCRPTPPTPTRTTRRTRRPRAPPPLPPRRSHSRRPRTRAPWRSASRSSSTSSGPSWYVRRRRSSQVNSDGVRTPHTHPDPRAPAQLGQDDARRAGAHGAHPREAQPGAPRKTPPAAVFIVHTPPPHR